MLQLGYALTSELHSAPEMTRHAAQAEQAGFGFALISDHFHPFFTRHAESPFVWAVVGAIAQATSNLRLGTGVTCPIVRYHPALVAQAAATCETLMPGRFFLGVGTGANLNEHVYGDRWPAPGERVDMLEEAVAVIRLLWRGERCSHHGRYFTVDRARLFSVPDAPPPLVVAASGMRMARLAARVGDGLVGLAPDKALIDTYLAAGDTQARPRYAQMAVCYARTEAAARHTAREWWPLGLVPGNVIPELPLPEHYDALTAGVTDEAIGQAVVCGPDPEKHLAGIRRFAAAGFTHVYLHQVGPDQEGFFEFYRREILPVVA
ncbi:MAG TPA: TIGR03557 family F420-dependent LLM class oxidoreductase [Anaerolineales bacterium]|nr:TIGR03557 family F420-dependent LLM class oxidoreductase [Anaerolineales bacterium]HRF49828.1 TIGR03557 family F420-dependent LLM class oxidoreductase [Anaerolineales bacterium]